MLVALPHLEWQVLRAVLRAEVSGTARGADLRLVPSRKTKDGTFLDGMVGDGLLITVGKIEPGDRPEPFRRRYKLTALGRHAAEYGEYDRPHVAGAAKPVVGVAAELLETLAARRTGRGKGK